MKRNAKEKLAAVAMLTASTLIVAGCNSGTTAPGVSAAITPTPSPVPVPTPTPTPTPTPIPPVGNAKHVLYIGLDGVTADAVRKFSVNKEESKIYNFLNNSSLDFGIYAGGNTGLGDSVDTWSAPGWTTLLTGYYSQDSYVISYPYTSITSNPATPELYTATFTGPNSIFNIVGKNGIASYAYGDWNILQAIFDIGKINGSSIPITKVLSSNSYEDYVANDKIVYTNTLSNINAIKASESSLTFTYFGEADEAGHEFGFDDQKNSSKYMVSLNTELNYVASLYQEIQLRRQRGENWLVIVASDHGGTLSGNHGGRSWKEKQVFAILNDNKADLPKEIYGQYQGQGAVAATVLDYFNINPGEKYRSLPIYQQKQNNSLQKVNGNYYLKFTNMALDKQDMLPIDEVTWPGGLNTYRSQIKFAMQDESNIYFFLKDSQFIKFNTLQNQIEGTVSTLDDTNWQGVEPYASKIKFGVSSPNTNQAFFFLNDGTYLASNLTTHHLQHGPYSINDQTWPGLTPYADKLQSAMGLNNEKIYFFLDDHTFIIYDTVLDKVVQEPESINDQTWPGLEFATHANKYNHEDENGKYNLFVPWDCSSTLFFVFLSPAYLD